MTKPKLVDCRSYTTKEELLEAILGLPDGARIYSAWDDGGTGHGRGQLEGAPCELYQLDIIDVELPYYPRSGKGPFSELVTFRAHSTEHPPSENGDGIREAWLLY